MANRSRRRWGWIIFGAGVLSAAGVYWHPEQLNVPAWVGYSACAAFVFAGLSIVAAEAMSRRVEAWFAVAFVAALLVPGAWIAFGPGVHECSVSVAFLNGTGSEIVCRSAFGLGSIVTAAFLYYVVRRVLCQRNAA